MTVAARIEVEGVRDTLRLLRQVDERAYWKSINRIKKRASTLVEQVNSNIPSTPPTRGFDHNGRTGWGNAKPATAQYGGRRSSKHRDSQTWPLVTIVNKSAPVAIADMAGRGPNGGQLARALEENGWGSPSRFMWRFSQRAQKEAESAILDAMKDVMREFNRKLAVTEVG